MLRCVASQRMWRPWSQQWTRVSGTPLGALLASRRIAPEFSPARKPGVASAHLQISSEFAWLLLFPRNWKWTTRPPPQKEDEPTPPRTVRRPRDGNLFHLNTFSIRLSLFFQDSYVWCQLVLVCWSCFIFEYFCHSGTPEHKSSLSHICASSQAMSIG